MRNNQRSGRKPAALYCNCSIYYDMSCEIQIHLFAVVVSLEYAVHFIRSGKHIGKGGVMVHEINDRRHEFAHVGLDEIRALAAQEEDR